MVTDFSWILNKPLFWVTLKEFKEMGEYSTSLPTGQTIGKRWKRQLYVGPYAGTWLVGEYVEDPDPDFVGIKWYRLACAGDSLPAVEVLERPWRKPTFSASMRGAYPDEGF